MKNPLPLSASPPLIVYVSHSGSAFGTERMALATLAGLPATCEALLLAPPGAVHALARSRGIASRVFDGRMALLATLRAALRGKRRATLVATALSHSLLAIALARMLGVQLRHVHVVHGGAEDHLSYGRKKWLRPFAVDFVAVSAFVRQRLASHGVPPARVQVIENFLDNSARPQRRPFAGPLRKIIVVSRLDPIKQVGVLLDALARRPALASMQVTVFGTGWQLPALSARAAADLPNVHFVGYSMHIAEQLAQADLLVHTCAEEPFGLVVLEAMAAGIPVLVPDTGGPSGFIKDDINGFLYRAGDAVDLGDRLAALRRLPPERLNHIVEQARHTLATRFDSTARCADYRAAFAVSA